MDTGSDRVAALEARIAELERRLATVEAAGDVVRVPSFAAPPPPPPPIAPHPPVQSTGVPTGTGAVAGWGSQARVALTVQRHAASESAPGPIASGDSGIAGAAVTASPARSRPSLRELEDRFAGRILAWTGGLALIAAAIFLLSLAFSRGWIGIEGRVLIGFLAGGVAFIGGAVILLRGNVIVGQVLTAVGLGIYAVAIMAATRLYGLVPPPVGLSAALIASIAAGALAIRADSRVIAAFGLVTGLIAPPLTGAAPDLLTLLFVGVTLVGTTAVALYRSWAWLPPLAFVLAAPQLAVWLLDASAPALALIALALFWLLNIVSAGGQEVRVRRDDLRASSVTLVVANAVFLAWGLAAVLDGGLRPWLGVAYVVAAALHATIGSWFLARQGLRHGFGSVVAAAGAGFLALAAVAQLSTAVVPAAWALEALVLVWVAVRLDYPAGARLAALLGALAIVHLVSVAYPFWDARLLPGAPFGHSETVSLVVVFGSLLAAAWIVPVRWVRAVLAGLAILCAAWVGPFELAGSGLVAWLAALAVAGVGLQRVVDSLPVRSIAAVPDLLVPAGDSPLAIGLAGLAGMVAWVGAAVVALTGPLDPARLFDGSGPPAIPFADAAAIQGGLLALAAAGMAALTTSSLLRLLALIAGLGVAAWLIPFEVGADLVVVLWSAIATGAWILATRETTFRQVIEWFAIGLAVLAISVAVTVVAPPSRLVVVSPAPADLSPAWPLSFVSVGLLLLGAARVAPRSAWRAALGLGAAATVTYGASIGVIAGFQVAVGGSVADEELAKQAQVALSVLWMTLGVLALVGGLVSQRAIVRDAGLGLLALATAKVFLVDLSSLDVAYRVLSLAALGLLLLASAWMYLRFRGQQPEPGEVPGDGMPRG